MMKTRWILWTLLLTAVLLLVFPGYAEDASLYTFQNGVSFGMSADEVKQTLKENAQIDEGMWIADDNGKWQYMSCYPPREIGVCSSGEGGTAARST